MRGARDDRQLVGDKPRPYERLGTKGVTIVVAGFIPALIPIEDYKHVSAKAISRREWWEARLK